MRRGLVTSALIVSYVLNPTLAAARDGAPPALEERIRDMENEAARFMSENLMSEDDFSPGARARVTLLNLPTGSKLAIVLRGGRRVAGELTNVESEEFTLLVDLDAEGNVNPALSHQPRGTHVKRRFQFEDVESLDLSRTSWMGPEALERLEAGKKVEVLLLDGSKVRGRLKSGTAEGFTLEQEGRATRDYPFEQVVMARKSGMKTSTAVLIAVGVGFGVMVGVTLATLDFPEIKGSLP